MKKAFTLFLAVIFMSLSFSANAQQDSLMYKIKYEKFKSWKKTGKILTITGATLAVVGSGFIIWMVTAEDTGIDDDDTAMVLSSVATGAGTLMLIPGVIYWGIGNSKTREYKLRLENVGTGVYYQPKTIYAPQSAGIVLAYRF